MSWYDEQGAQLAVAPSGGGDGDRVSVNSGNNLTLVDARPENTCRYLCVAKATVADDSQITIMNVLRVNGQLLHDIRIYMGLVLITFKKIVHVNLATGHVATSGVRLTHCRRAQSFNYICQVARWARQSNTRFRWPTLLAIPNGRSIGSAVFARQMLHFASPFPKKLPIPV